MALTKVDDRGLKTPIDLQDNEKIRLGTGNDLELYHDGSGSHILNSAGSGQLTISSDNALNLASRTGTEYFFRGYTNGAAELYYDNSKKFDTTSYGTRTTGNHTITGQLTLETDGQKAAFGAGSDFEIYHDGTNTLNIIDAKNGNLRLRVNDGENAVNCVANGAVELYYDNSKKLETISTGVKVQSSAAHCHLKINSANSNSSVIHFGTAADDDMAQIWYDDYSDALYYRTSTNTPQIFYTNNVERMRIDSSGRLLLGTTTEGHDNADNLTVADTGNSGITIRSGTGNAGNIYFSDGTSGGAEYDGYISYSQSINSLDFGTNNATRLRIDSSGNVGIGNTNPSSFHSSGENLVIGSGSGDEGMTVYSGTGNSGIINFADGTSGSDSYEGRILYRHADNAMSFHTNNGAERVRINSGGAVLIGTTTGTTDSSCNLRVNFDQNTSSGRAIEISHNTNGADKAGAALGLSIDNGGESTNAATLTFSTASGGSLSERMRIASAGHTFFQGMTSLTASTSNKGINIENQSNNGRMNIHANNSAGNVLGIGFYHSGSHVGGIYYSSSATSYNTSSDYRLKENVTAISDGITRLKTLKPSRFNFKVDKDTKVDGFLAHEVTAVPEAITGTKDEVDSDKKPVYQSIDQSKLVPLLTAALQEAITKVETLEKKVAALEAK